MTASRSRVHCHDCNVVAPDLDGEHTLRSSYGWRYMPERQPDGTIAPVWRCPSCWQKKKQRASSP